MTFFVIYISSYECILVSIKTKPFRWTAIEDLLFGHQKAVKKTSVIYSFDKIEQISVGMHLKKRSINSLKLGWTKNGQKENNYNLIFIYTVYIKKQVFLFHVPHKNIHENPCKKTPTLICVF